MSGMQAAYALQRAEASAELAAAWLEKCGRRRWAWLLRRWAARMDRWGEAVVDA